MRTANFYQPVKLRHPLNRGLLRWWLVEKQRFGGLHLRELTRKSRMTLSGALRLSARGHQGGNGYALFDGTDDYGQTAAIDLSGISTMTVSCWLYWNAFANDDDLSIESSANVGSTANVGAIQFDPNQGAGNFRVVVRVDNGVGSAGQSGVTFTRPSAAVWHHYVATFDRNAGAQQVVAVYIDGVSQSLSASGTATASSGGFGNHAWNFMCRNAASNFGAGRLDDIRIHNRVLSAGEALSLYRESRTGNRNTLRWTREAEWWHSEVEAPPDEPDVPPVPGTGSYGLCLGFGVESSLETPKALPSLPPGARMAIITAEGGTVRWRADGSDPGNDEGHPIVDTQTIRWAGPFEQMRFIRDNIGQSPSITVSYFG